MEVSRWQFRQSTIMGHGGIEVAFLLLSSYYHGAWGHEHGLYLTFIFSYAIFNLYNENSNLVQIKKVITNY